MNASWQRIGHKVGLKGDPQPVKAFTKRANSCAKYGESADFTEFEIGYERGVEQFCDVNNAVKLGERGALRAINDGVCSELDFPAFASAFNAGYKMHQLNRRVYESQNEIDYLQDRIYQNRRQRDVLADHIRSGDLSDKEVNRARYRLRSLEREIRSIRSNLYRYRGRLAEHQRAADAYRNLLEIEYDLD